MRFKIDEKPPIEVAETLAARGHDAVSVVDQTLGGAADSQIAGVCSAENRCLLTLDVDFADIRSYPPGFHSGIIVLRLMIQDKGSTLDVISRLLRAIEKQSPEGALWIVDERRIRIREGT